jgi:hypothetical protein
VEDLLASPAANMGTLTRERSPHAVSLTWYPALTRADYGIGTSGAYWMRGLKARHSGPGVTARVDATSGAEPSTFAGLVNTSGPVVTGDTPPLVGAYQEQAWQTGEPAPRDTTVEVAVTNVAAATLELTRAGFGIGEPGSVVVHTDGQLTLTITGLAAGEAISRGSTVVAHANANGTARIRIAAGATTVALG